MWPPAPTRFSMTLGLPSCHAPRALGRQVRGEQRPRWPQARQFDYSGTEPWRGGRSVQMSFSVGTRVARGVARQPPLPLNSCRRLLRAKRRGSTGRDRLMRYIAIVALAFAFTGSAHGASNDPKATRKGGEEDTASKAAEGTAQQIAKPEIYWLDSAYRRSDGALIQEQREFLRNKGDPRFLPPFSSFAECEAEAKYRMNWRGGRDSPVFERADCRPTAITRKMLNAVRKGYCWDDPKRQAWERPECRTAVEGLINILERELKSK